MTERSVIFEFAEYVRTHPELCYGKVGDGKEYDDCIYCMLQEVLDNAVDEFLFGYGTEVEISVDYESGAMSVRDYGRGAFINKLDACFGRNLNYSGMWGNDEHISIRDLIADAGVRKVCALSKNFSVRSVRDGEFGEIVFECGRQISYVQGKCADGERRGTLVRWSPEAAIFPNCSISPEHVNRRITNCAMANPEMKFILNGVQVHA